MSKPTDSKITYVFCSECGAKCDNRDKFCFVCGCKLKVAPDIKPPPTTVLIKEPEVQDIPIYEINESKSDQSGYSSEPDKKKRLSIFHKKRNSLFTTEKPASEEKPKKEKEKKKEKKPKKNKLKDLFRKSKPIIEEKEINKHFSDSDIPPAEKEVETPRFSESAKLPVRNSVRKSLGIEGIPNEVNPLVDTTQTKENVSERKKMFEKGSAPSMPEEYSKFKVNKKMEVPSVVGRTTTLIRTESFFNKYGTGIVQLENCPVCNEPCTYKQDRVIVTGKEWHRDCWLTKSQQLTMEAGGTPLPVNPGPSSVDSPKEETEKKTIQTTKVFRIPLRILLENEDRGTCIPIVMEKCVLYLLENAKSIEGIFRMNANAVEMTKVIQMADAGNAKEIDFNQFEDRHVSSGILKKFLRELPDSLLTNELYTCFIAVWEIRDDEHRKKRLKEVVWLLPDENRFLLEYLLSFLGEIAQDAATNRMTTQNLATIFGPLLLRYDHELTNEELLSDSSASCNLVREMIEQRGFLFLK